jgi:predicted transport protein
MAKDSQRIEQEFIATAKEKTGHDLADWMAIISSSGESKTRAIIKWLKQNHDLNHMQANLLAGIYLNDGKPVFDYEVMFGKLFEGKEAQQAIYEELASRIQAAHPEVHFIPTKTYISLENERVFGCVKLTSKTLRIGLDLGEREVDNYVQKAKGLGAMPNIGHMIEISSADDINERLLGCVGQAYARGKR